jgi:hypothetical protein
MRSAVPPISRSCWQTAHKPILHLLGDYATVRNGLGVPDDPAKLARDVAPSVNLQNQLWQQAVTVTTTARDMSLRRFAVRSFFQAPTVAYFTDW